MIFGLTGKKRAGKDTAGGFIRELFGEKKVEVLSFAQPLKEAICSLFVLDKDTLEERKDIPLDYWDNRTPRDMLKHIGDACRGFDKDSIVKNMRRRLLSLEADVIIVTDIRYDDEANLIRDLGGAIIKIERETGHIDTHPTEQGISDALCDATIKNTTSLEDFRRIVRFVIKKLTE